MELINNLEIKQEDFSPQKLRLLEGDFNKGIPGQSLTNSPEQPYAWESPPVYTSVPEAATAIFADMTEEENYLSLLRALKSGTSVVDIASAILYCNSSDKGPIILRPRKFLHSVDRSNLSHLVGLQSRCNL